MHIRLLLCSQTPHSQHTARLCTLSGHQHQRDQVRILIEKSRMTPKKGVTVTKAEMCSVVIMSRLVVLATLHLAGQIQRILMSTNKVCVVSPIQKNGHVLLPYWQARISEVTKHREDLAKEGCEVEEVLHLRAEDNLADLRTRRLAKLSKLGPHSKWQAGPSFLSLLCDQWLLRDLAAINLDKTTAAAGAAGPSCEILNTTTLTKAEARRHWIIRQFIKYGRLRRMAA